MRKVLYSLNSDRWKIADFGLTNDRTLIEYYQAPELCMNDGNYTTMTDVYALGLIVFEIAMGRTLSNDGKEVPAYMPSEDSIPTLFLPHWGHLVSEVLTTSIKQMLDQYPLNRPSAQYILQRFVELYRAQRDLSVVRKPPSIPRRGTSISKSIRLK